MTLAVNKTGGQGLISKAHQHAMPALKICAILAFHFIVGDAGLQ